jgi:uncharacterized membrane protein YhaH (DUF805 family)
MNTEVNSEVSNPYSAPKVNTQAPLPTDGEPQEVKLFSIAGRIGRVRYIGYSIGLSVLIMALGGILAAATSMFVIVLAYIALIVMQVMLTIQRCHDFNTSGWLSLLMLIPLVNFIFWFVPGTDGANNYGNKTPPNTTMSILLACILPLIFVLGIVAAVALPAYSDYTKRARAAQSR